MEQLFDFVSEHWILSSLWLVVFFLLVSDLVKKRFSTVRPLKPQEATIAVNRGGIFLDTRDAEEFAKGHIHGSKNVPLAKIRAGETKTLDKYKDAPIVTVCNYGNTARSAAAALEKAGFTKVSVLQGGLQAWQSANLPISKPKPEGTNKKKKKK